MNGVCIGSFQINADVIFAVEIILETALTIRLLPGRL
jgi:hypothetical protein